MARVRRGEIDQPLESRKSLSMSDIAVERHFDLEKKKSYLSNRNLEDCQISISGNNFKTLDMDIQNLETSRVSRLLDSLLCEDFHYESDCQESGIIPFDIEDLVHVYINERNSKDETRQLLCKLQTNYDLLQRKFANAENIIDAYRIQGINPKANHRFNSTKNEFGSFRKDEIQSDSIPDQNSTHSFSNSHPETLFLQSGEENLVESSKNLSFPSQIPSTNQLKCHKNAKHFFKSLEFDSGFPPSDQSLVLKSPVSKDFIEKNDRFTNSQSDMIISTLSDEIDKEISDLRQIYKNHSEEMIEILSQSRRTDVLQLQDSLGLTLTDSKKKTKNKKNVPSFHVLNALHEANTLATLLKDRSANVVRTLRQDLETWQNDLSLESLPVK